MSAGASAIKKPVWKKWWFWVAVVLVLGAIGNGTDGETPSNSATESAQPAVQQPTAEAPAQVNESEESPMPDDSGTPSDSQARAYAGTVKVTLDVTTSEDLLIQMPDEIQPDLSRDGENRTFTWTFSDGSQIIAVFRPAAGEGSGEGLLLYMVDIKD